MNKNEHAFPQSTIVGDCIKTEGGVTMRDYFAAEALPECLAQTCAEIKKVGYCPEDWRYCVALDAYAMADAMLKARNKSEAE